MSFLNKSQILAMLTQTYICPECGEIMEWETENEDSLVCPECGHSMDSEMYGLDEDESYESLYPTKEELEFDSEVGSEREYYDPDIDE